MSIPTMNRLNTILRRYTKEADKKGFKSQAEFMEALLDFWVRKNIEGKFAVLNKQIIMIDEVDQNLIKKIVGERIERKNEFSDILDIDEI
jgi:hypothetical protein